jgi:hypothetical protein
MIATYRIHINEFTMELLNSIKASFKDKRVEIIVSDEIDKDDSLLTKDYSDAESFKFWLAEEEDLYQDYLKKKPE